MYYYYDEEEVPKKGVSSDSQKVLRTTPPSKVNASGNDHNSNRSRYSSAERSTTVEPASNEIIPNRHGNRGRQLGESAEEEILEDRLPNSTRFPAR